MPPSLRIDSTNLFTSFHSFSKRCLITSSVDNQFALLLLDQLYTFKCVKNHIHVTGHLLVDPKSRFDLSKTSKIDNDTNKRNCNYYIDLQKAMCTNATLDNPKFTWVCWTPKCFIKDNKNTCALCTITLDNRIDLWIPADDSTNDVYTMENVLDIKGSIERDVYDGNVYISVGSDELVSTKRILACLNTVGYSSCDFVELEESKLGFLCLLSVDVYLMVLWISNVPIKSEIRSNALIGRRRSARSAKFNVYDSIYDEPIQKNNLKRPVDDHPSLDLNGYQVLNQSFNDINDFDITKCKDYFPIVSNKIYSNSLHAKTLTIMDIGYCTSIMGRHLYENTFLVHFTNNRINTLEIKLVFKDRGTIEKIIINQGESYTIKHSEENIPPEPSSSAEKFPIRHTEVPSRLISGNPVEEIKGNSLQEGDTSKLLSITDGSPLDLLKYHVLFDIRLLTCTSGNMLYLYFIDDVVKSIACGSLPLISTTLEPQFYMNGNLCKITLVNSNGTVYIVFVDENFDLKSSEFTDKSAPVPLFTSNNNVLTYECLINKHTIDLKANLRTKNVFLTVLNILLNGGNLVEFKEFICNNKDAIPNNSIFHTIGCNRTGKLEECKTLRELTILLEAWLKDDDVLNLFYSSMQGTDVDNLTYSFILYLITFMDINTDFDINRNLIQFTDDKIRGMCCRIIQKISINSNQLPQLLQFIAMPNVVNILKPKIADKS